VFFRYVSDVFVKNTLKELGGKAGERLPAAHMDGAATWYRGALAPRSVAPPCEWNLRGSWAATVGPNSKAANR
jgi:hypothetical protein